MQCSIKEDVAVVTQSSTPVNEPLVMKSRSHKDKDVVMQRSGDEDEAKGMQ